MDREYSEALKLGEVLVTYGRVMMIGAGGAGKTSLRHGLMKKLLPKVASSTLLANSSSVKYQWTGASGQRWVEIDEEDEINELAILLSRIIADKSLLSSVGSASAIKDFQPFTQPPSEWTQSASISTRDHSDTVEKIREEVFRRVMFVDDQPHFEVLLNLWDSGGQVVFMNVLPAFLTKRTLFMLVFDASENLEKKLLVVARHAGKIVHTEDYHLNTTELLLQWMASIDAHLSLRSAGATIDPYPRIMLIGTHLDRLVSKGCDPPVEPKKILDSLHSQYENKAYADLLMPSPGYIVDNTTAGQEKEDPAFQTIRECVHDFATTNFSVPTPVTWVFFRKVMQRGSQANKPVMRYSEVIEVAEACSVPTNAIPSVLNFYHELGVFLYYSKIPTLREAIIATPQWLVDHIAKLLTPHGFEDQGRERLWKLLREKGILTEILYKEVLAHSILPPQALVDLLEHFLLMVPIKTTHIHHYKGKEYFVPCMLKAPSQTTVTQSSNSEETSAPIHTAKPMHLIFDTHYVPPGFYVRLLATVARNPNCRVLFQQINRFTVTVAYQEVDEITLREHADSIEVQVSRNAQGGLHVPPFHQVCRNILLNIETSIIKVRKWLPGVSVNTAFVCSTCCPELPKHFVKFDLDTLTTTTVRCKNEKLQELGQQQNWLKMPKQSSPNSVPQITEEPDSLENVFLGKPAEFVVKAIGKHLTYTWYRQTTKQLSPSEKRVFVGNTPFLHIDEVELDDEGYYVCTICNPTGGSVETKPAQLTTIPQITEEPDSLENTTPGNPVEFVVKALGKNLNYTWHCQTAKQLLPSEKIVRVGNTKILRIDKVESNDEGYYVCTICNPTGGSVETKPVQLTTIPQITEEPDSMENTTPGNPVEFVVKALGKNLNYTWHCQTAKQLLPSEKIVRVGNTKILLIDKVESNDEGYYVCTICNPTGGIVETKPTQLTTIPQITEGPDSLENVTPGKPAVFVVKAIGKNLTYTWHRQTAKHLLQSEKRVFVGNTQILHIDKVESNDEGYYVCTICNPTGGIVETKPAQLTTIPQITEGPDSLENVTPGKPAVFVVKAFGKNLTYTWHRQTAKHLLQSEKRVFVGNTQILHIDKVESNDEGYYVCTICNPTGGIVETKPAQLTTIPQITEEPDSLENVSPGKPAEFVVKAIGKNLTYTWHRQTAEQLLQSEKRVFVRNTQILHIDKVESNNEGYYVCTICNPTGGIVETKPAQLTTIPQITEKPDSLENVTPGKPAVFVVEALGKNLAYTWHHQTAKQLLPSDKRVSVGNTQILRIHEVESKDEGYYVCTISNPTGGSVETKPVQLTTRTTFWSKYRNLLTASAVVLVIAILIAITGGLGLSMWPQWHSNTAARFQTPGQPEATPGSVSQVDPDFNCHRIESSLDLFEELESIANWYMLCFKLGVSDGKIDSIKNTYHSDIANKKKECLDAFFKLGGVCWEQIVTVVSSYPFENKRLAKEIADRHGVEYSVH